MNREGVWVPRGRPRGGGAGLSARKTGGSWGIPTTPTEPPFRLAGAVVGVPRGTPTGTDHLWDPHLGQALREVENGHAKGKIVITA
ncbi:hypothetical protein Hesp01_67120 [Herbidospora sp. NBRC 101105]|nr:hypothetical protein Hesp01_67120 [Herbidospora sp. NBRC 101105]